MVREMNAAAQDPRVQRTKQQLRQALVTLLKTETPKTISIQTVTKLAGITRGTFYLHYDDKQDFMQATIQDLIDDFYQKVTVSQTTKPTCDQVNLQALFEYVEQKQQTFKVFHQNEATLAFKDRLTQEMRQLLQTYIEVQFKEASQADQIEMSITADYLAGASLVLVFKWIEDGLVYSPRYMAKILYQLVQMPNVHFDLAQFFIETQESID
ncbi:TetR/AcrR family transcriptional regulator [Latilactobacillus fuchuensis]|uniref:Transcription regulator, TetR family n=2 Tax=Latilactobacillus fuchuensis TaxID=164393 RepID=A0A2N9DUK3_9LACO|nr:TetR/AcrR family transcriptional regulator [Latilactobacillus fuchuensis]KRL61516.1 transcription regulator, TetR family [Latilactobacillus fuchuensis DSM 14340 = JCM 11249]SPC37751.1 Transcription regulator, TetR family [Latilactobacillus fuchuensis]